MALKLKDSKNLDSDTGQIKDDLFLQNLKQIMNENPRLYSKLAKL